MTCLLILFFFFFFNDTATTEIYTLSLHDALPISFHQAMLAAEKVVPKEFEKIPYFEGCIPIEVMAERGRDTMMFGPMKPVGLVDPRTNARPYAVVQLRMENRHGTCYNLVGVQTKLTYAAQKRVFRMIPGLENAEFLRYGSVH